MSNESNDNNDGNNDNGNNSTPAAAALQPDYAAELAQLRAENEALKLERSKQDEEIAAARMKVIEDSAKKPLKPVSAGQQDLALNRAIQKIGNAKFHQLSNAERCAYLGIEGSEQIKDSEIQKYMGAKSSSAAAAQLQRTQPSTYAKYRAIFKARNLK